MFKAINKPNRQTELIKLKERLVEYVNGDIMSDTKPVSPIGEVDETKVGIRTSFGSLRWMFLVPWLLGVGVSFYWHVEDFYLGWKAREQTYIDFIEHNKMIHGDDYFFETSDEVAIEMYNHINADGFLTLREYIAVLSDGPGGGYYLIEDIVIGSIHAGVILALIFSILGFVRRVPLYFDRSRGVVYTWRKGYVWAQYYDEQWFYQNHQAMTFILYSFDRKDRFKQRNFVVMPTGNPFMNGETVYRPVLAFITQFMEYGRDAVFDRDWEGRRGWYLFSDKKPEDFNDQLESVLKYIKTERVNEEADRLGEEWGCLNNAKPE